MKTERKKSFKNVYLKIMIMILFLSAALNFSRSRSFCLKQITRVNSFDSNKLSVRYKSPNLKEFTVLRKKSHPLLPISTTCLVGIILVGSEIRRGLSLGETSVGLGETLHGRNSLWAKPVVTLQLGHNKKTRASKRLHQRHGITLFW